MRIYLRNINVGLDLGPLIVGDVIGKDEIIAVDWWFLAPEEVNSRSMYDSTMGFEFYWLAIAFIVEFDPSVLLDFLADIDAVEVC